MLAGTTSAVARSSVGTALEHRCTLSLQELADHCVCRDDRSQSATVAGNTYEQSSSLSSHLHAPISLCNLIHGRVHCKVSLKEAAAGPNAFRSQQHISPAPCRYRKRGVNDKGQVANDVETEQMLHAGQDRRTGMPLLSSAVQASSKARIRAVRVLLHWGARLPLLLSAVYASLKQDLVLGTLPFRAAGMFMLWSTVQAGDFILLGMQLCCTAGVTALLFCCPGWRHTGSDMQVYHLPGKQHLSLFHRCSVHHGVADMAGPLCRCGAASHCTGCSRGQPS